MTLYHSVLYFTEELLNKIHEYGCNAVSNFTSRAKPIEHYETFSKLHLSFYKVIHFKQTASQAFSSKRSTPLR